MDKTVCGVKFEGSWKETVTKAKEITNILEKIAKKEKLEDWNKWRPRLKESLEKEVRDKTVKEARISKGTLEENGKKPSQEAKEAVEDAGEAMKCVRDGKGHNESSKKVKSAFSKFFLSLDAVLRKIIRYFETLVYRDIIGKTNAQYFDSELVSASIRRKKREQIANHFHHNGKDKKENRYVLSVNINDEEILEKFQEEIKRKREQKNFQKKDDNKNKIKARKTEAQ